MTLLAAGILIWSVVHLLPTGARSLRRKLVLKTGLNAYKGIFSLVILAALVIIVIGWRRAVPEPVYLPLSWGREAAFVLMLVASVLFVAAQLKTNIKRLLRHPQLSGLCLWSVAHLLANGDTRSVLLFTGLALWAIVMMLTANRRDGEWRRPQPVSPKYDVLAVSAGAVLYSMFFLSHYYLSGVSLPAAG